MAGGEMFQSESKAIRYIQTNKKTLIEKLKEQEIKTVYTGDNTRISIMKDGNNILRIKNHYGERNIADIFKEFIDLGLI